MNDQEEIKSENLFSKWRKILYKKTKKKLTINIIFKLLQINLKTFL